MILEILILACFSIGWFLIGYNVAAGKRTPINTEDINDYIQKNFPDLWAAYKKGVTEGYEQGLRDGQGLEHESA